MSFVELPSNISYPEDKSRASLRKVYISIDVLSLVLTNSQERLQALFSYMVAQHENIKLQMQPQAVTGSDLFLYKISPHKMFVSADLYPYINLMQVINQVLSEIYNLDPLTSRLLNYYVVHHIPKF